MRGLSRRSAYEQLLAEPRRFRFDAAVRVLLRAAGSDDPGAVVRFRTTPGTAYPAAEVSSLEPAKNGHLAELATPVIGLVGASGVLPRLYSEVLTTTLRNRSRALHDFLDMLSHRVVGMFARGAIKYRLDRSTETAVSGGRTNQDPAAEALLAFCGFATPHLVSRFAAGPEVLLHYAGFFATRPRSADRLEALVSDWLGRRVEVVQFAGTWLSLAVDQQTALARGHHPGAWNRLARDATIGERAWDPQARIILRVGPLDYRSFAALLPDRAGLQRLVSLVRAYVGYEVGFAVNPVLAGPEVPPLRLDQAADPAPRLGWNSWIPAPEPPLPGMTRGDAGEALFEAEIVEAEELASRGPR